MQKRCVDFIHYTPHFLRSLQKLSPSVQKLAQEKEEWFRHNPFDPRLHTHPLKGKLAGAWAYSVNYEYRVLFRFLKSNEDIYYDIDNHDIYR